jgi:hypothetical protein
MATKPTQLAVHRNTVESRRKRALAKQLTERTAKLVRDADIRAYAVVGIAADGSVHALWDTGAIMPMWAFPDTIGNALRRDMENTDVDEDWRPALPLGGSR